MTITETLEKADVAGWVREAVSDNAEQVQQKASQLASVAKDLSKTTADTATSAVKKVNVSAGRGAAPYVAGGLVALVVLWVIARRRRKQAG
jgi:MYXO-CTERM domain-containing protein